MELRNRYIERMREAMSANDLNNRELAKRCGLSEASISRYLSGNMTPRVRAISKMAQALHVDPVWLMGYDTPEEPDFTGTTAKLSMLIECLSNDEKAQVERFIKFIINSRGGNEQ